MNVKEYLDNAYKINEQVEGKFEQLRYYQELSTKVNNTLSLLPGKATKDVHRMENIYVMIGDLERETQEEIINLLAIIKKIKRMIAKLDSREHQVVLELRYQNMKTWEQIATDMGYNARHARRLRDEAVCMLEKILRQNGKIT